MHRCIITRGSFRSEEARNFIPAKSRKELLENFRQPSKLNVGPQILPLVLKPISGRKNT